MKSKAVELIEELDQENPIEEEKFEAEVDWYDEAREMGMLTLKGGDWFGMDRMQFSGSVAPKGVKKGDMVKIEVSGGRKRPVVQSMK